MSKRQCPFNDDQSRQFKQFITQRMQSINSDQAYMEQIYRARIAAAEAQKIKDGMGSATDVPDEDMCCEDEDSEVAQITEASGSGTQDPSPPQTVPSDLNQRPTTPPSDRKRLGKNIDPNSNVESSSDEENYPLSMREAGRRRNKYRRYMLHQSQVREPSPIPSRKDMSEGGSIPTTERPRTLRQLCLDPFFVPLIPVEEQSWPPRQGEAAYNDSEEMEL
ncbi:uncharacterized protein LOC128998405 isoform X2 [Macrosteles quadrilineatus]|uniref:uncharacterized protein LOC128998405 isoform X2 n=1 Tax=Macrosteles quadrilineatus TaxID=74068 RepID=UPI0023E26712|nr:uncharacterized protein LOC128998405 isoform X2 [Macrosteles quadrilineatus]